MLKINDKAIFVNSYAYPSLSGKKVIIKDIPDKNYDFYSVQFDDGTRMACYGNELIKEITSP